MTALDGLVASATVGLAVRPVSFDGWPPELRPPVSGEVSAATVLDAAALMTAARRSQPTFSTGEPVPDPPDLPAPQTWRPGARGVVRQLLAERPEIVAAACKILVAHGAAVPIRELPELAAKAIAPGSPLRAVLAQAAGPRGRWLLGENPAWRGLLSAAEAVPVEADDDAWLHGDLDHRLAWLAARRSAEPDAARQALADVWGQQKTGEKSELLAVLATGLGPGDVPFLEQARVDRSAQVSKVAVRLLSHVPEGAFADRRAGLIAAHARVDKAFLGKPKLAVSEIPADPKDGIPEGAEHGVMSLIESTPLPLWYRVLGYHPPDLAKMAQTGVSFDAATAFFRAAVEQHDLDLVVQFFAAADQPWNKLQKGDLAGIPYNVRIELAKRTVDQADQSGIATAILWLGSPLPEAILDTCLAALARYPALLAFPEIAAALVAARPDQLARVRALADRVPDPQKPAAGRTLTYLTLLTRLNQELS